MAGITYQDGGSKRAIDQVFYQDGGTRRTIQNIYYQDGSNRRLVYSAYTPMTVSCSGFTESGIDATTINYTSTQSATCSVSGGNSPKTYAWEWVSGNVFTISSPSSASTHFTQGAKPPAGTYSGVYRCTVSDGVTSKSATCTVTMIRT